MEEFGRVAVYWLPEGGLGDWGEGWLGWDMAEGAALPRPQVAGLPDGIEAITRAATVYGLHATVKPPFRLAPGTDLPGLQAATGALCAGLAPVTLAGLEMSNLDGFLALTPAGETAALDRLAARIVEGLDAFRAPAPPEELARRRARGLSARQEDYLTRFGYPYVLEEFRFHVTLTGPQDRTAAEATARALAPHLAPHLGQSVRIGRLSLVGERTGGRGYKLISHHALAG